MEFVRTFALRIKRGETPFFARLRRIARYLMTFALPVPRLLKPVLSTLFLVHWGMRGAFRRFITVIYREPIFRGRCKSVGKRLNLERVPYVKGNVEITIGDDVTISGALSIGTGRVIDNPQLVIGNNVFIGHNVAIAVGREVVIEDGAALASGCFVADSDTHPADLQRRVQGLPPAPEEILPVRIGRNAWIGRGSYILKGVTIGEGAVVAVGSVVLSDVPAYGIAIGVPTRVTQVRTAASSVGTPSERIGDRVRA